MNTLHITSFGSEIALAIATNQGKRVPLATVAAGGNLQGSLLLAMFERLSLTSDYIDLDLTPLHAAWVLKMTQIAGVKDSISHAIKLAARSGGALTVEEARITLA
jgi:hypothetical protein